MLKEATGTVYMDPTLTEAPPATDLWLVDGSLVVATPRELLSSRLKFMPGLSINGVAAVLTLFDAKAELTRREWSSLVAQRCRITDSSAGKTVGRAIKALTQAEIPTLYVSEDSKRIGYQLRNPDLLLEKVGVKPFGVDSPDSLHSSSPTRKSETEFSQTFQRLYEQHSGRMATFIRMNYGGSYERQEIEDVLQKVFIKAWHALARFDLSKADTTKFSDPDEGMLMKGWLYEILNNEVTDHLRDFQRQRGIQSSLDTIKESTGREPIFSGTAREMDSIIASDELVTALSELTTEQRQVILLRFVHDQKFADIALEMGKNEAAVKKLQERGLASLRRILASYQQD